MPGESLEDEDDVFSETLNTVLFLFLGILSVTLSMIILAHSAIATLNGQNLSMELLNRMILIAFFFVAGLGSLHVFRMRRESRKRKKSAIFTGTQDQLPTNEE